MAKMSVKIDHYLKRLLVCSNIMEITPDSLVRSASGVISKLSVLEHVHTRKMACHAKFPFLYLQKGMLKVEYIFGA